MKHVHAIATVAHGWSSIGLLDLRISVAIAVGAGWTLAAIIFWLTHQRRGPLQRAAR